MGVVLLRLELQVAQKYTLKVLEKQICMPLRHMSYQLLFGKNAYIEHAGK